MTKFTYEQSVHWLREQLQYSQLVEQCYLNVDNLEAAKNFSASEEFFEVIKVLELSKADKPLKILDLGCGNGIASYAFASLGHEVYAVDPDQSEDIGLGATTRLASKLDKGVITTHQAFAESLPFQNSTFDIIYARQALHHFSNLKQGVAECARVLKPEGLFLATREHVVSDEKQLEEFLNNHILHKLHGGENAHLLEDYIATIEEAGFKVLNCFAPFDTVINHFPTSNHQIKEQLFQSLSKKTGNFLASRISKLELIERMYRNYLSRLCNSPGRLYSFVCKKT